MKALKKSLRARRGEDIKKLDGISAMVGDRPVDISLRLQSARRARLRVATPFLVELVDWRCRTVVPLGVYRVRQ